MFALMGLASLAAVPPGMFFCIRMMATGSGFYPRTIAKAKTQKNRCEVHGWYPCIKVIVNTKSSYDGREGLISPKGSRLTL